MWAMWKLKDRAQFGDNPGPARFSSPIRIQLRKNRLSAQEVPVPLTGSAADGMCAAGSRSAI